METNLSAVESSIFDFLDESILLRERRRWSAQERWKLLVVAFLICLSGALPLASLPDWWGNTQRIHDLFGIFVGVSMACASVLAFVQAMQVLRHEIWSQTIEGLFLTLQKTRGVILSVVASGVLAGLALLALLLPFILFFSVCLSVPAIPLLTAFAVILCTLFLSASMGALWFFITQHLSPARMSSQRVLINLVALLTGVIAAWGACGVHWYASPFDYVRMATTGVWIGIAYFSLGAAIWSIRTIWQEAAEIGQPGHPDSQGEAERVLATALRIASLGLLLLTLIPAGGLLKLLLPQYISLDYLSIFNPFAVVCALCAGPAPLYVASTDSNAGVLPLLTLGFLGYQLLLALGVTTATVRLYRWLRSRPEESTVFNPAKLKIVDVVQDDWRGFRNPVLTRELRTRLRSGDARMFLGIAAFASALAAVVPLLVLGGGEMDAPKIADLARSSFIAISIVQMIIVCMIGPGVGAEVIVIEKEKKTFEMLLSSRLGASEILWGKVLGVLALLLILVSPSFPLLALAAFLHGVSTLAVGIEIGVLLLFSFLIAVVSVSISALARSSVVGKWVAYVAGLVLLLASAWVAPFLASNTDSAGTFVFAPAAGALVLLWFPAVRRLRGVGTKFDAIIPSQSRRGLDWDAYLPAAKPGDTPTTRTR